MMQQGSDDAGVSNWSATDDAGSIEITGNGAYTISYDIPENCGAEQIDFLGISTDINIYEQNADEVEMYKNMTFDIDSILIDGVEIEYNASSNANGVNDDGSTFRLSIYDTWSKRNVQDIDNVVSCASNITINFTVNGIVGASDSVVSTDVVSETETQATTSATTTTQGISTVTNATTTIGNQLEEVTTVANESISANVTTTQKLNILDTADNASNGNVTTSALVIGASNDTTTTSGNETTTSASSDTTNPTTGDSGLGVVVVALTIAGLSVATLNKRK
jgi:hypothetical protein